ncbi:MAG: phosphoglucomutase (alpha-D-glucose-1,6-bisphosphate-dependent) [Anaerolineales bacterium]
MNMHESAGKPAPREALVSVPWLMAAYYAYHPDPRDPDEQVSFGTSGHRGSSLEKSFNEEHILAVSQAIVEYRQQEGIGGPLYLGMDTHALSHAAFVSALEVFAAHGVEVMIDEERGYTPTPVISHAILTHNRKYEGKGSLADGVVITPSHNPPGDGGIKYNPPTGGPAGPEITGWIEERANEIIAQGLQAVKRVPFARAEHADTTHPYDYTTPYVDDLRAVLDLEVVAQAGLKLGVDPMGGAAVHYWEPIAEIYGLDLEVVNPRVDPTFAFMTLDRDGEIRMDPSSSYAMASLIDLKDRFRVAFGNDPDGDRHGIVAAGTGLMNPNHYLAVAVWYLLQHRPDWPAGAAVGKTLVTSAMLDRVARDLGRRVAEVPVGFKWFVEGLLDASYCFGGEESAGASFLRRDGTVWTTDKDGIVAALLAAEITAVTGKDPGEHYRDLTEKFGAPVYRRIDKPATLQQKQALKSLSPERVKADSLAGEEVLQKLTRAPANGAPIGGLKVITENGWFAARPSGTEDKYKLYAESFKGEEHLEQLLQEAERIVQEVFEDEGV